MTSEKQSQKFHTDDDYNYPDLVSASDWSCLMGNLIQPIRSTTHIWVATCHQYGISAHVSQTSFGQATSGCIAKCQLSSQAIFYAKGKIHQRLCNIVLSGFVIFTLLPDFLSFAYTITPILIVIPFPHVKIAACSSTRPCSKLGGTACKGSEEDGNVVTSSNYIVTLVKLALQCTSQFQNYPSPLVIP